MVCCFDELELDLQIAVLSDFFCFSSCCLMERISDCMDALSCREGEQVQEAGTPDAKWGDVGLVDDGGVEIAFPESESDERMDIRASVMEINRNWESQNDYGIVST